MSRPMESRLSLACTGPMACTADKTAAMLQCIFCDHELTAEKTTTRVDCPSCIGVFGNTIDKTVADQVASRSEDKL